MNTMLLQLVLLVKSYVPSVEREEGQGMVEYALIIALVAVVIALLIPGVTTAIGATFTDITNCLGGTC